MGGPGDAAALQEFVGDEARVHTDPGSTSVWLAADHDEGILVHYERWVIRQPGLPEENGNSNTESWLDGWHSSMFRFIDMWDRDFKERLELVSE